MVLYLYFTLKVAQVLKGERWTHSYILHCKKVSLDVYDNVADFATLVAAHSKEVVKEFA